MMIWTFIKMRKRGDADVKIRFVQKNTERKENRMKKKQRPEFARAGYSDKAKETQKIKIRDSDLVKKNIRRVNYHKKQPK